MHQHRVNRHADDDEERLKAQGKQRPKVILSHLAPSVIHHGRHGNGGKRRNNVDFHHPAINDDENADAERLKGHAHEQGLKPQPQQRAQLHLLQPHLQISNDLHKVNVRIRADDSGGAAHDALRRVKDPHDDIPGVGNDQDGAEGLENPFEEDPGFKTLQVVLFQHQLQKLQRHHNGQNHTGDGENHVVRQAADHAVDAAVPCLRRRAHLPRNAADLLVDVVKQALQVAHNTADQDSLEPFRHFVPDKIQFLPSFWLPASRGNGKPEAAAEAADGLAEQPLEQGNQRQTQRGHAAARHELFHALAFRAGVIRSISFQKVNAAPDTKTRAQSNHQRLQYVYRAIEKSHTSSLSAALRQPKNLEMKKAADRAAQSVDDF